MPYQESCVKNLQLNARVINLRALAILLIVFGHSIILYSPEWGVMQTDITSPIFHFIKSRIINPFQLTVFFAISGYLFYNTGGGGKFLFYLRKKLFRLMLPYCLIASLWMDPIKYILGVSGFANLAEASHSIWGQLIMSYELGHLWFLPTLMGLFIIALSLHNRKGSYFYILLTGLLLYLAKYFFRIPSVFQLYNICTYFLPFAIGYFANKLPNAYYPLYFIVTLSSFITCIIFPKFELLFVGVFLMSIFKTIPNKTNSIIKSISKNSYGIYLFHSPLVYITFTHFYNSSPILVFGINFFVFGAFSYIMTSLIRKTSLVIAIGEEYKKHD